MYCSERIDTVVQLMMDEEKERKGEKREIQEG